MKMLKFINLRKKENLDISYIIELVFIGLYTYTALEKLLDFDIWIIKLFKTGFFSLSFSYFLGVGVPIAEFVIVFCLIFQLKFCYQINFFFILVLTLYLIFHHYFSLSENCSCGGLLERLDFVSHLLFNIGLLFLSSVLLYYKKRQKRAALGE